MNFFEYVADLSKSDAKLKKLYDEEKNTSTQTYQTEIARLREELANLRKILQSGQAIAAPAISCNIKFYDYMTELTKRDPQLRKLYMDEMRSTPTNPKRELMRIRDEINKVKSSIKTKNAASGGPVIDASSLGAMGNNPSGVNINSLKTKPTVPTQASNIGGNPGPMGGGIKVNPRGLNMNGMGGNMNGMGGNMNGMGGNMNGMGGNMNGMGGNMNGMGGVSTPAQPQPTPTPAPEPQIDVSKYEKEVEEANNRASNAEREKERAMTFADEWKAKYTQAYEDLANTRKILEKDVAEEKKNALQGMVKELIPVIDSFDLIFKNNANVDETIKPFIESFKMTYNKLMNLLRNKNVEMIVPNIGDEYDSDYMEALQASEGPEDNKVVEIFCNAFKFNGLLIRPARVVISKKKV